MSKEDCSATVLTLEKFKKIKLSLQEDLFHEEKRERKAKHSVFLRKRGSQARGLQKKVCVYTLQQGR